MTQAVKTKDPLILEDGEVPVKGALVHQDAARPTVVQDDNPLMALIARAASDPTFDVAKMQALLDMKQQIDAKDAEREFNAAMNEVQREIRPVIADANNPQTKSKYATYEHLDHFLRPIYTKHGFSISFGTGEIDRVEVVRVTAKLRHSSGHSEPYHIDMPADGKGAKGGDVMTKTHATGSAMSYGKRYLLIAMFNIPIRGDDDDGNRAGQTGFITIQQKDEIVQLLKDTDSDVEAFLKFMEVEFVDEIPAIKYRKAMNALQAKKKQAQGDKK